MRGLSVTGSPALLLNSNASELETRLVMYDEGLGQGIKYLSCQ
jgi:hypothetical protein